MTLHVKYLSTGWVQVRGEGFNDFWQGPRYPAEEEVLPLGFFEECSQDFRRAVFSDNRERTRDAQCGLLTWPGQED